MAYDLPSLARRLERAQALQNERFNQAAGGRSLAVGGGFAHFRGEGHPLNQALGLIGPVAEPELEAVEAFLGAPTVLELSPGADPSLWILLARRGDFETKDDCRQYSAALHGRCGDLGK